MTIYPEGSVTRMRQLNPGGFDTMDVLRAHGFTKFAGHTWGEKIPFDRGSLRVWVSRSGKWRSDNGFSGPDSASLQTFLENGEKP